MHAAGIKRKLGGGKGREKKKFDPAKPHEFIDFAKTQPVDRPNVPVSFDQLNEKQKLTVNLVIDALKWKTGHIIASGDAGTGALITQNV